jgi:double-strand break repair protein MRE11
MAAGARDEDSLLKILIATDNHLGFMEKDPVRCNDSFAAFEEILQIGKENKVDMVLLGGDLFHENKPSRHSVFKAIELLRKYTLGDDAIKICISSQQKENFRSGRVNYEDPNFNVGMPVFSINGNHDDPTRDTGTEALSACDILSASNLLNYFGTQAQIKEILLKPILIDKGETKLALYGLGAIRDERLNRLFTAGQVKFLRPMETKREYFNLMVLHQNRDRGRGPKNCVHESFLPKFLDLVMWGHEHDCLIDVVASTQGYHITQPGSSVATQLTPGEALKKHVAIVKIHKTDFLMKKIPLKAVRPFCFEEIVLSEVEALEGTSESDPNAGVKVHRALTQKIEEMIEKVHREENTKTGFGKISRGKDQRVLPLIRCKVERTGYPMLNVQRFGNQFTGRIANPTSVVRFYKRKSGERAGRNRRAGEMVDIMGGEDSGFSENGIGGVSMGNRIVRELEKRNAKLELLPEPRMNEALTKYVHKGEAQALQKCIERTVLLTQKALKRNRMVDPEKIKEAVAQDTEIKRNQDREEKQKAARDAASVSSPSESNVNTSGGVEENGVDHSNGNGALRGKKRRSAGGSGSAGRSAKRAKKKPVNKIKPRSAKSSNPFALAKGSRSRTSRRATEVIAVSSSDDEIGNSQEEEMPTASSPGETGTGLDSHFDDFEADSPVPDSAPRRSPRRKSSRTRAAARASSVKKGQPKKRSFGARRSQQK